MDEIKLNLENLTTEEREQLMKLVEKGNIKPVDKQKVWKPELGDVYYFTWSNGEIDNSEWDNDDADNFKWMVGNVYRTEEECQFVIEKQKVEFELKRFAKEHNEDVFNVFDLDTEKWYLNYNIDEDLVEILSMYGYISSMTIFSSETIAKQAIETVGSDRIKKYIFGVK